MFRSQIAWILVVVAAFCLAGCHRQAPGSSSVSDAKPGADTRTRAGVAPMADDSTVIVIAAPDNGDMGPVLGDLSKELRRYVLVSRNSPQSFEEFVQKAHIQAPPPPAGQHYAIENGAIVLVSR